ncbi:unnamed protein product, partial [marine sediment metagenome]
GLNSPFQFICSDNTGTQTSYLYDYFNVHDVGEVNILLAGGFSSSGAAAGVACLTSAPDAALSNPVVGGRLEFIPEAPAVAYEKTLTESLGLADKVVKAPSVMKTEPLGLLDTYSRTWAAYRVYPEILGLSDTVIASRVFLKVLTELLGFSDTLVKEPGKVLSESLGLVDVYGRTWSVYRTYIGVPGVAG